MAPTFREPPQVCSCGNVPKRTAKFCIQCGKPWESSEPPLKRLRPDPASLAPPLTPAPLLVEALPTPKPPPPPLPTALLQPEMAPQLQLQPPAAPMEPAGLQAWGTEAVA